MSYCFVEQELGMLKMFREPEQGMVYTLGIDAATGLGQDYSCGQVFTNTIPTEQVAIFRGQLPVNEFSKEMDRLGRYYNEALIVCEVNYPGNSVQEALLQYYKYPRNYQSETHLDEDIDISSKYGFRTTEMSKWLLINETQIGLSSNEIILNDIVTISEFLNFVYRESKRKAAAAEGFCDDTVIAAMLAYHGVKLYPFVMPIKKAERKAIAVDPDAKKSWRLFRERIGADRKEGVLL
jgi:hypothetical protein